MKQAGFTQESFEACLKNQQIYDGVNAVKDRGAKSFDVNSTPTFFINGQMQRGALSVEELDKILEPLSGAERRLALADVIPTSRGARNRAAHRELSAARSRLGGRARGIAPP